MEHSDLRLASYPSSGCPKAACASTTSRIVRLGKYWRKDDSRWVQRFVCRHCRTTFSAATRKDSYRQKRRRLNPWILRLLTHKASQRGIARMLSVHRLTVARRIVYFGRRAEAYFAHLKPGRIKHIQFDEMQSSIHTKCKPVSMPLAVCAATRMILHVDVCVMPAQHPLFEISMKKYGPRPDDRPEAVARAMRRIAPFLMGDGQITTDRALHYYEPIRTILPGTVHNDFKSRRARIGGQGELKRIGFDPLFSVNHTAAMFRDGVSRLIRKTWCNSKRIDMLRWHMLIYAEYFNKHLI